MFFFFQAEDGIRDGHVTGVQTCALPILTVPDEEVNSSGMRCAVHKFLELQEEHGLTYKLFLNSESVFSQEPNVHKHYIYTGTIRTLMPAALFYGQETHTGEPLSGMIRPYI